MSSGLGRKRPRSGAGGVSLAAAPHRVRLPVNIHHWDDIAFLHWPFEPEAVNALLPDQLEVLTYEGAAWVGVTPFFIRVRPPGVPIVPPGWAFPETNVRTYVTAQDGRHGVWFIRMEVTAMWFVITLRSLGLPYFRHHMSVDVGDDAVTYTSAPRSPSGDGGHRIVVKPGEELDPPVGGARDRFLTARWGAFHRRGPLLMYTPVEHQPWALRTAAVEDCDVHALFASARLPIPSGPPLAHFSPGVTVKVGPPQVVI